MSDSGYVYFLRPVGGGPVKIGWSKQPGSRLAVYLSWSPAPLEIVATVEADRTTEARLHREFDHLRMHHEWFEPAESLLRMLAHVAHTGEIPSEAGLDPEEAEPSIATETINAFGGTTDASAALGVPYTTVDTWRRKGKIPGWRWPQIRAVAQENNIDLPQGAVCGEAA